MPLQHWTRELLDLLLDARDTLDDEAYAWWIAVATQAFGVDAARLSVGEAIRSKRNAARA